MTPFIGVRISWLMLARNSDLSRADSSGGVARPLQLRLDPLPLGDVADDRADRLAAGVHACG